MTRPPAPTFWALIRRAYYSRGALSPWHRLVILSTTLAGLFLALFSADVLVIGWQAAYEVALGLRSPGDAGGPWLTWPLSVAGWLVIPVVAGATAGAVVVRALARAR
jgi:hypothetical protein